MILYIDMTDKVFLTQEKYDEVVIDLDNRITQKRKDIVAAIKLAGSRGDARENAELDKAKREQAENESMIRYLQHLIDNVSIIEKKKGGDIVEIGSKVCIKDKGVKKTYMIVGSAEADFEKGKISFESPLGKKLLHKKKGENIELETPKGTKTVSIFDIL